MQKIICVDFDGVLHSYRSGWKGATIIPDPPVVGAIAWLTEMVDDGRFEVCIYSSRSKEKGAIEAMKLWLINFGIPMSTLRGIQFPTQKPAAHLMIDDRAFLFQGTFPAPDWVAEFKPWNKK
jgi:hypothetical protein